MQFKLWANHNNGAARIIDALSEKVLAETALLTLKHVRHRLKRTFVGACNDAAAAAIIKQSVDRFLQHTLFIADDDVWRTKLNQALQAVITVNYAAVQIIQIRGRKAATV